MTVDTTNYGNPDHAPTGQNPTIIPQFDPVFALDGNAAFISPTELLLQNPRLPAVATITVTGSITAGDTAFIELANEILPEGARQVATLCVSGDTITIVAQRLVNLFNADPVFAKYGVTASMAIVSSDPVITIRWPGPVGNFTAISSFSNVSSATIVIGGTVVTGDVITVGNASATLPKTSAFVDLAGTVTTGDVISATFYNASLPNGEITVSYTAAGGNTLATIATALASAINAQASLTAIGMSANATGKTLFIVWSAAYQAVRINVSSYKAGTEVLTIIASPGTAPSALAPSPLPSVLITVSGSATTGDIITLFINAQSPLNQSGPVQVQYTVQGGDTTALIAAGLAAAIEASSVLGGSFYTDVDGSEIAVTWEPNIGAVGFDYSVAGIPTESARVTSSPALVPISYTTVGADTTTIIATALRDAYNANVILQAAGLVATSSTVTVTIKYNGALNPLTLSKGINGVETATVGGTITAGDVLSLVITDDALPGGLVTLPYTVPSGATTTTIATALKNAINASAILASALITATSSGAVVSITSLSHSQTTYARTLSAGATETITLANTATETVTITPSVPQQTITIGGSATAGDYVTAIVNDPVVEGGTATAQYLVKSGDTLTLVAAGLAAAIAQNPLLVAAGLSATSNGAVITIVNRNANPDPTFVTWGTSIETATLGGTLTTGNVVNILFTNALLDTGSYNLQYVVLSSDTTLTILAASIAAAINANATLAELELEATSSGAVVSIDYPTDIGALTFAGNVNGTTTMTLGGTVTAADVITVTVTDANVVGTPLAVPYTIQAGDTTLTILAASIAALLQATAALTSKGITATSSGAVVSMKSVSTKLTTFARTLSGGATETATLAAGPTETITLAGAPTETFTVSNPTAGSEVLTPSGAMLAGGAGPVIPVENFNMVQEGQITSYWTGTPVTADYPTVAQLVDGRMPVI